MESVSGRIIIVQEGRFALATDTGRVIQFVLSHRAAAEPQDLPPLQQAAVRVRVGYSASKHLLAAIAQRISTED